MAYHRADENSTLANRSADSSGNLARSLEFLQNRGKGDARGRLGTREEMWDRADEGAALLREKIIPELDYAAYEVT